MNTARKDGGLGPVKVPLLSDKNHRLSRDYGVLLEGEGIALRGMFLIDPQGVLKQASISLSLVYDDKVRRGGDADER